MSAAHVLLQGPGGQSSLLYFVESLGDEFFMRRLAAAANLIDTKQLNMIRFTSLGGVLCADDIPAMLRHWKEGMEATALGLEVEAGELQLNDLQPVWHGHVLEHATLLSHLCLTMHLYSWTCRLV